MSRSAKLAEHEECNSGTIDFKWDTDEYYIIKTNIIE